jgi:HlyD family secretion protein
MLYPIRILIVGIISGLTLLSCSNSANEFDSSGMFEANEVIVAAEGTGKILALNLEEGQKLTKGEQVGYLDSTQLYLSKLHLRENRKAVLASRPDMRAQIEATKMEIENAILEKKRIENLVKGEVASQKQLDDINSRLSVLQARLAAQQNSLSTTTASLNEQGNAISIQLAIVEDQLLRSRIINPIEGTVLSKYLMQNEMAVPGKAIYKIADLSSIILRSYISGTQLSQIKLGQQVKVFVDAPDNKYKEYDGTIAWVSDKAEFTPKTIQTKEERANLVYAIKIDVKNDGYLKLGMYGEVKFN